MKKIIIIIIRKRQIEYTLTYEFILDTVRAKIKELECANLDNNNQKSKKMKHNE